ncbi:PREDICTED: interleukin-13 [Elephantulus edwardii]|uniref:interleukin-13 n=1 Tax=Elephantulus edwardii TaxID=28737 RepID=UPI0003F0BD2F|nr:PREDICTED: interleukin-13 [Elephantulus edwardii]
MALWLTVVIALTCLSGLASPGPVNKEDIALQELMNELINITKNQKEPLCNGSMVWSVNFANFTTYAQYCAAAEALANVSECSSSIQKSYKQLNGLCKQHSPPGNQASSLQVRDTKIELSEFVKQLLDHLRIIYRTG